MIEYNPNVDEEDVISEAWACKECERANDMCRACEYAYMFDEWSTST